MGKDSLF